jgi:hypothetical protein
MATPEDPKALLFKIHIYVVARAPDLKRVSFYSEMEFLYYSSTTSLLVSLIYKKGSYPRSGTLPQHGKSSSALWRLWRANSCEIAMRDQAANTVGSK